MLNPFTIGRLTAIVEAAGVGGENLVSHVCANPSEALWPALEKMIQCKDPLLAMVQGIMVPSGVVLPSQALLDVQQEEFSQGLDLGRAEVSLARFHHFWFGG